MKKVSLLLLFCLSLLVFGCGQKPKVATIGEAAPDFTLVDRKGKTWTLSELKGQVVFVNFWATWCPPCREEMPSMQKLYTMLPGDKFKMLAILNKDDPALADSFAAKLGITMPILNDQQNTIGPKYGLTGVPETFIVDKQGILREKYIGPAQWDSPGVVQMLTNYISQ
ncbi:MAG: TlpA family protein disulfide reductase [Proteobacteria bacterium]|nr:TlpA family protein disulfide reductase [Desulfobulbaceae bacterium]MBU4153008.1 TlpA family protein disulfide reductase [Pseudomonadota bacterium]